MYNLTVWTCVDVLDVEVFWPHYSPVMFLVVSLAATDTFWKLLTSFLSPSLYIVWTHLFISSNTWAQHLISVNQAKPEEGPYFKYLFWVTDCLLSFSHSTSNTITTDSFTLYRQWVTYNYGIKTNWILLQNCHWHHYFDIANSSTVSQLIKKQLSLFI